MEIPTKNQFSKRLNHIFTEFLDAVGEERLAGFITAADWSNINLFAPRFKDLLKKYYYVGGMPEAVLAYSEERNMQTVREIQNEILKSYDLDFSKMAYRVSMSDFREESWMTNLPLWAVEAM